MRNSKFYEAAAVFALMFVLGVSFLSPIGTKQTAKYQTAQLAAR